MSGRTARPNVPPVAAGSCNPGADGSAQCRGHADREQLRVTWPAPGGTDLCWGAPGPDPALRGHSVRRERTTPYGCELVPARLVPAARVPRRPASPRCTTHSFEPTSHRYEYKAWSTTTCRSTERASSA